MEKTKRITRTIAAVLLFTFCANPVCYAAYNYSLDKETNTVAKFPVKNRTDSKSIALAQNSVPSEKTANAQTGKPDNATTINQSVLNGYLDKNNEFFKKYTFPQSVSKLDVNSMLAAQNDGVHSSADVPMDTVKGRVELPWYNGNYIVWNTGMSDKTYYSAEYNSNKNEAGFVVIQKPRSKINFYTCYEYADGTYDQPLKSIFIYYKDSHRAAFLYDENKNLLMYQIDGTNKIEKPALIKNSQFMSEITAIFDNPSAAVKAGKKYSLQPQTAKIYNHTAAVPVNLNYQAATFNMDRIQAINGYYWAKANNTPVKLKLYDMMVKNPQYTHEQINLSVKQADEFPESFYKAIEKGIIPDYMRPTMYLCNKENLMNSLVDVFDMMKANNFPEQDIKNIVWYYYDALFKDEQTISKADAQSVMNNSSLSLKDKYYHLYAKLAAKHLNNPDVETDILNAYALLKQHPELVQSGFDNSILKDETLRILQYYPAACQTENAIKTVLAQKNIPNKERFYKILGQLKAQEIKDLGEEYPETYYEIAKEGILAFGFNDKDNVKRYIKDEAVLKDALAAAKLLMKNRYYDWASVDNGDIFVIAPELHITTKVVSEVLKDNSVPYNKKEAKMASLLYKAYYQAQDKNVTDDYYKLSAAGYKLIEKGYCPKYINDVYLKYYSRDDKYLSYIDLMVKNGLSDDDIKILITAIHKGNIKNADQILSSAFNNKTYTPKRKAKEAYKELYLTKLIKQSDESESNFLQRKNNAAKLLDNDIIPMNIKEADRFGYIDSNYYNVDEENISTLISLKNTAGFKERDIEEYVGYDERLSHLSNALNTVLNDNSIKIEDRPAFVAALTKREIEKTKNNQKKDKYKLSKELLNKALDEGLWTYYSPNNCSNDTELSKTLNLYIRLRDDLKLDGNSMDEIFNTLEKYDYNGTSIYNAAYKAANKQDATEKSIIRAIQKANDSAERKETVKKTIKQLPITILAIVTFPIWIIPALLLVNADWR